MENEFIPYEQALALKKLGFDENCLAHFNGGGFKMLPVYDPLKNSEIKENWFCVTPLYQQAFKWFRDKHNLFASFHCPEYEVSNYEYRIYKINDSEVESEEFETHEDSELGCLKKLIELVK